jgi:dihydrodipicolinate synthase/N-acetylneuraminate lyase
MNFKWNGVFPAVTTKFNDDDTLDFNMFNTNLDAQLDAGVHGIILGGTLGEASSLDEDEKFELVRNTVQHVNGKVPVILNIAEQSTKNAIRYVVNATQAGANGFMLLPPMRYSASDREVVEYFSQIAKSTDLPIMIYNNPVDYKTLVTLEMFDALSKFENINAVKESTRDISNVTRMINCFGDRFKILSGVDTLALESLFMGAHGWVAGLVCAFPKETVAIYNYVQQKEYDKALEIYRWFLPLLELDINARLVQNIKLAEVYTGIGTENVRAPRLKLEGSERDHVVSIIENGLKNRPSV